MLIKLLIQILRVYIYCISSVFFLAMANQWPQLRCLNRVFGWELLEALHQREQRYGVTPRESDTFALPRKHEARARGLNLQIPTSTKLERNDIKEMATFENHSSSLIGLWQWSFQWHYQFMYVNTWSIAQWWPLAKGISSWLRCSLCRAYEPPSKREIPSSCPARA